MEVDDVALVMARECVSLDAVNRSDQTEKILAMNRGQVSSVNDGTIDALTKITPRSA